METNYILIPDAENRLSEGFWKRIQSYKWGLPYEYWFVSPGDVAGDVKSLKERWFYTSLKEQFPEVHERFRTVGNAIFEWDNPPRWSVKKPKEIREHSASIDDLILFTGILTSEILKNPDTFWKQWEEHEFVHPVDFVASLGVFLKNQKETSSLRYENPEQAYVSIRSDGSRVQTVTTGSMHGDFRIIQTDLSPYETISPFGNISSFRPIFKEDISYLSPYHSTEPAFFSIVLKYAEQIGMQDELAQAMDSALQGYAWKGQTIGNFADFWSNNGGCRLNLLDHAYDIPKKWEEWRFRWYTLYSQNHSGYQAFIDTDDSLVFLRIGKNGDIGETVCMRFYPNELPDLIWVFFTHARNGTGRTSLGNLIEMLEYYRSDKFKQDKERMLKK